MSEGHHNIRNFLLGLAGLGIIAVSAAYLIGGEGSQDAQTAFTRAQAAVRQLGSKVNDERVAALQREIAALRAQLADQADAQVPAAPETAAPSITGGQENWTPPIEPAGVVRHAKQTPPNLWGSDDPEGQPYCDQYSPGKKFVGWVGKGLQRHAFCEKT